MITWLVELNCGACYSRLTVPVKAVLCPFEPDHIHVEVAGIQKWWFLNHRDPDLDPIAPVASVPARGGVRSTHHRGTPHTGEQQ